MVRFKRFSIYSLGIISSLMDHCVEKTLTFLKDHCTRILYANYSDNQLCQDSARGVQEIQRMLAILSSLFDKYILRDNDETFDILDHLKNQRYTNSCSSSDTGSGRSSSIPAHDANTVVSSFVYTYIWAFGGDLHERLVQIFISSKVVLAINCNRTFSIQSHVNLLPSQNTLKITLRQECISRNDITKIRLSIKVWIMVKQNNCEKTVSCNMIN